MGQMLGHAQVLRCGPSTGTGVVADEQVVIAAVFVLPQCLPVQGVTTRGRRSMRWRCVTGDSARQQRSPSERPSDRVLLRRAALVRASATIISIRDASA